MTIFPTAPESASGGLAGVDAPAFADEAHAYRIRSDISHLAREINQRDAPSDAKHVRAGTWNSRREDAANFAIPASFARGDPAGSCCIFSLVHRQELDLQVQTDGALPDVLTGHLGAARWLELNLISATLRHALATANVIDAEALTDRTALVRLGAKWSPALRILAHNAFDEQTLSRAWAVCEAVLSSITKSAQERRNLHVGCIDPAGQAAVREAVESAVERSRGCNFAHPLLVQGAQGLALELKGKLGRKRDKSDHAAKPIDLAGHIGGFMRMERENYIVLQPPEGPKVRIDFLEEQLRAEGAAGSDAALSLVELARMNAQHVTCTIRVHQTKDAQGRAVYTFVRMLASAEGSG
jgi:hypothetical protein